MSVDRIRSLNLSILSDINQVVRELIKDFGVFVMTRRYIIDCYEKVITPLQIST